MENIPSIHKSQAQLWDSLAIADLIQMERLYRDQQQWENLREMYHPDAQICIGWFRGSRDEYVESSRKLESRKPGWHLTHITSPTQVHVHHERALAETNTLIIRRSPLHDVLIDATIYCILVSRVERREGTWRILTLDAIYEKDTVVPVYPEERPLLDRAELNQAPGAYQFTAYNLRRLGYSVDPQQLCSTTEPEGVARFYEEAYAWLRADLPLS